MQIGIPKEIKNNEYRVGLLPQYVEQLCQNGHQVWVEHNAASGIQITDQDYLTAGAKIVDQAALYQQAELIVKVKEPQPSEYALLNAKHILFTFLHLAASQSLTQALTQSGATCIAYETIELANGQLPLLYPMSEIAGRLSIQAGTHMLEKAQGGMGKLLGGLAGVAPAHVVIIGAGIVGQNALQMALGLQANVTILDTNIEKLRLIKSQYPTQVTCLLSDPVNLKAAVLSADLVIGSVLQPGKKAPQILPKSWLKQMPKGAVLVDVAIDQGGCFETSKPTTHQNPAYIVDDIVHYCVANMPGAVPLTATQSLNNATFKYIKAIADLGLTQACNTFNELNSGINIRQNKICHPDIAESFGLKI
ncbi:alanine dehydrogenase [Catenovulum sp. 2E275]|uniref:alanine dehydrogenase n=1 Tax=Catenovulum sp. 2E275 TaxID=2980497 RepID=UPI0021D15735|nr:alanine dehydrogenase [Catenovulum sp. 2E275]MCU4676007.1 alanine dehydrogenase [Catenovulum sp. 2E275]